MMIWREKHFIFFKDILEIYYNFSYKVYPQLIYSYERHIISCNLYIESLFVIRISSFVTIIMIKKKLIFHDFYPQTNGFFLCYQRISCENFRQ